MPDFETKRKIMTSALFTAAKHAQLYAKFRPYPPDTFIKSILAYLEQKIKPPFKTALDIGCGSGQSTIVLSPHFDRVIGLDISEAQIKNAKKQNPAPNVEYKVSKDDILPAFPSSVQLVTFCQSVHWFNTEDVFSKIENILAPNGVIAAYGYWIPLPNIKDETKNQQLKELITQYLHEDQLGSYWDKERYIVQNHYADIKLPFKNSQRLNYVKKSVTNLADYIGYLSTWSSYQKLFAEDSTKAEHLLQEIKNKFLTILNEDKSPEETIFPLHTDYFMLMGRK